MKKNDYMKMISVNTVALGSFELPQAVEDPGYIPIQRDASGIPVAWRIFKLGENSYTKNGENIILVFTEAMFDSIIAYFAEKGEKVPLDSKHFLYHLANKLNVDESELLRLLPDGIGTFGFCSLEKRPDGLWVVNAEYVPLARQLMAEGIIRYFSPVVRGFVDGRLRITSVTFENEPAINNLDAIAASSEDRHFMGLDEIQGKLDALAASAHIRTNQQKEKKVKKLFTALAGLLGMDSISLAADGDASADVVTKIEAIKTEVSGLREGKAKVVAFIGSVKDELGLGADADLNAVEGRILAMAEKAGQADQLKLRVDALELSAETGKREKLIDQGKAEGKLTEAMLASEWLKKQDSLSLCAFLKDAPLVVALGSIDKKKLPETDAVVLSAEDKEVCAQLGISEEKFLATKKEQSKKF